MISPLQATLLGVVEGLTEFLPVSSTGHLILAGRLLRLHGEAIKTFEVVIQGGALAAVFSLYRARVASMWRGLMGQDAAGSALLIKVLVSVLPAAAAGVLLRHVIKARLFATWPVVAALGVGGMLMVGVERRLRDRAAGSMALESLTLRSALLIGCAQCLSLWPGTSRAMVTIVAGRVLGLPAAVAAEYSFLLALPTLGAATLFDVATGARGLVQQVGTFSIICGVTAAALMATLSVRGFLRCVTRWGLAPFGWYRIGLAAVVWSVATLP